MFRPNLILHPTDFSDSAAQAFSLAVDLARQFGAKLLVVHVAETLGPENVTFGEAAAQLQPEGYRQRLLEQLHRQIPPPGPEIALEHLLLEGDPARAIAQIARERSVGLIVMATHGRTGLRRILMGSVAEQVLRHADCPVLTL